MLCKHCGKELPVAEKFCPYCGNAVEQSGAYAETIIFLSVPEERNGVIDLTAKNRMAQPEFDETREDDAYTDYDGNYEADYGDRYDEGYSEGYDRGYDGGYADGEDGYDPEYDEAYDEDGYDSEYDEYADASAPTRRFSRAARRRTVDEWDEDDESLDAYYGQSDYHEPYHRISPILKILGAMFALLVVGGLIFFGVHYLQEQKPSENLTLAEKYLQNGKFEEALTAFQAALSEVKEPSAVQLQIDQLESFFNAKEYVENEQWDSALAALNDLRRRLMDTDSKLSEEVNSMIDQVKAIQEENQISDNLSEVEGHLDEEELDQAEEALETLTDQQETFTDEQQQKIDILQQQLQEAQESAQRQEENEQEQAAQREAFSSQISQLESNDSSIGAVDTPEEQLEATATSFQAWDSLLNEMYNYLASIMNADDYAEEEANYQAWIQERDSGAESAATSGGEEEIDGQLASVSFKQTYTKDKCYELLDKLS